MYSLILREVRGKLMQNDNDIVELKSHNSNFILNIFTDDYQEAIEFIKKKFADDNIFRNISINSINAEKLDIIEVQRIKDFLKDELGVKYQEKKQVKRPKKEEKKQIQEQLNQEKLTNEIMDNNDYKTKIIKSSLRSGAYINYDGNILVIGDINAGAELVATGNIIVIGILRGFANAGAKGDKDTMVIANKINATQLRIAEFIAVPPKDDKKETTGMQMAVIGKNGIVIKEIN